MDIVITCSKCKAELQLSPEPYQNDGVDRWSTEPHTCEAAQQSVQADVPYAPVKHPFACPECGRIGQVVCDNTAYR